MFFAMISDMMFLGSVLYPLGWMVTTTGFLVVLYSRLHLILDSPKLLKSLLFIIFGIGVPLQIFMVVAATGADSHHLHRLGEGVWHVTIRLEMVFLFLEIILSASYVYLFANFMHHGSDGAVDPYLKRTFWILIVAESFVIVG
jgi:hypothetical protein